MADLDVKNGARVVQAIKDGGGQATFVEANVAKPESVEVLVKQTVAAYQRLDLAVNNAGIGGEANPTGSYGIEGWQRVIDVNLNGVFYCMRYEIPQMLLSGGGAIVNMASILGAVGFASAPAYVAAKHGVVGLTRTAAIEYAAQGIRINAVGPGFIQTPMISSALDEAATQYVTGLHPIGRLGQAQEIANLVAFLCSDEASFVTGSYYLADEAYTAQ